MDATPNQRTIDAMAGCPAVQSVNEWNGRHYLNLYGAARTFRGDQTAKLWVDSKGVLNREAGKGTRSDPFRESWAAALAHAEANGIRVVDR